ncbi:MAG TPA: serine hydrolase domain-containing protein [Fimbriimonadaceae bacterium]|nr:serine hydrolase domain-containing protein [Fimbriimonadaceae bacterium]HRJ95950.1 serine hydrolase domain-containing protein [Fimbriimonadaceae bacterium]
MTPDRAMALLERGIAERVFPGAAAAWGSLDGQSRAVAGRFTYDPDAPLVHEDSLFDLASLTKVVATTARLQTLVREGRLDLDAPLLGRVGVTARHLLAHTSGLPSCRRYEELTLDAGEALRLALEEPLESAPGERTLYCDVGFIWLGYLAEQMGLPLDEGLPHGFLFRPPALERKRCLPTGPVEPWRHRLWQQQARNPLPERAGFLQGEVHDPRAALLGGVAGHAGLFGTLDAVAGWAHGRLLAAQEDPLEREWASTQSPDGKRGLGWDLDPGGLASIAPGIYGHTGFTGTLVALDPVQRRFLVLLTNRVHPSADSLAIRDLRRAFLEAAWIKPGAS